MEKFIVREDVVDNLVVGAPEKWASPAPGWLKANIDASFSNGRVGLDLVFKNKFGELVLLMSKVVEFCSAQAAEVEALAWTSDIVAKEGWINMEFSSDAANVIKEVNSTFDLEQWDTILEVLHIKVKCSNFNWTFVWNRRFANQVADGVAKDSLARNCCFYFDSSCS